MSFDLAVWEGPRPADDEAALAVYGRFVEQLNYGDAGEVSGQIRDYVGALLARWPDISEVGGEDSPWADAPLIANARGFFIYLSVVWSRAEEASAFAARLAADHGLVCFDPQNEVLLTGRTEK